MTDPTTLAAVERLTKIAFDNDVHYGSDRLGWMVGDVPTADLRTILADHIRQAELIKELEQENERLRSAVAKASTDLCGTPPQAVMDTGWAVGKVEKITRACLAERERAERAEQMSERQRVALTSARNQFRRYAESHRAKRTEDGDTKALTNEEFAGMCDAALSATPPAAPSLPADDVSSLIAARCSALPGKLIDCPVCGAVDKERDRQEADVGSAGRLQQVAALIRLARAETDPSDRDAILHAALDFATNDEEALAEGQALAPFADRVAGEEQ